MASQLKAKSSILNISLLHVKKGYLPSLTAALAFSLPVFILHAFMQYLFLNQKNF